MTSVLAGLVMALPSRRVLDPLRPRWPGLFGSVYQIDERSWGVLIVSSVEGVSFAEIAPAVDELFHTLELGQYVRNKIVRNEAYTFELAEPLSGWTAKLQNVL